MQGNCFNCEEHNIGCKEIDAACVKYNKDDLTCISPPIPSGTSLEEIIKEFEQKLCLNSSVPIIPCVKEILGISETTDTLSASSLLSYIQQWICSYIDENVKVTSGDNSTGYLYDKVETGECLDKTVIEDEFGNQKLKIAINFGCLTQKLPLCFNITPSECIIIDNSGQSCLPQPTTPVISRSSTTLIGTNCNGTIEWYNSQNQLVGTGINFIGNANTKYFAKCVTSCGTSQNSNVIEIPNITTYTAKRTALFLKECGVNECSVPCFSTSIEYTKTYTSTISQSDANSKAENDTGFSLEGQAKANAEGVCTCPDCNCVFPTYNSNIVITNATCNGQVVVANGQILITGITNANKMGFSFGAGAYSGQNYIDAVPLNNYNQGNVETTPTTVKLKGLSIETRVIVRLYNQANNCFKDVVITLTPPDCTQEQVEIEDVSITCEVSTATCLNYDITAGGSGATYWYQDCTTGNYTSTTVLANQTVSRCSRIEPQVVGGVSNLKGECP